MARAPQPLPSETLFNAKRERKVNFYFEHRPALAGRGWTVDNNIANVAGNAYNLSVFSKTSFNRDADKSFLIKITGRGTHESFRVGIVSKNFVEQHNNKVRDDRRSSFLWGKQGDINPSMGKVASRDCFNMGISLTGQVHRNGDQFVGPVCDSKEDDFTAMKLRIDIKERCIWCRCPDLWDSHHPSIPIPASAGDLVLGVCSSTGIFTLHEIVNFAPLRPHKSLKPRNEWLPDAELHEKVRDMKQQIVANLQDRTRDNRINIRIIGAWGHGKSSLANTLMTAFLDEVYESPVMDNQVLYGGTSESGTGTSMFQERQLPKSGIWICDTFGAKPAVLEDRTVVNYVDCIHVLVRGEIRHGFIEDDMKRIGRRNLVDPHAVQDPFDEKQQEAERETPPQRRGYQKRLSLDERTHGMIGVVTSSAVSAEIENFWREVFRIRQKEVSLPMVGALSRIDDFMDEDGKNILSFSLKHVYDNHKISSAMEKARGILSIQNVLPVRNYTNEDERNDEMEYLAVVLLKRIVEAAERYKRTMVVEVEDAATDQNIGTVSVEFDSEEF